MVSRLLDAASLVGGGPSPVAGPCGRPPVAPGLRVLRRLAGDYESLSDPWSELAQPEAARPLSVPGCSGSSAVSAPSSEARGPAGRAEDRGRMSGIGLMALSDQAASSLRWVAISRPIAPASPSWPSVSPPPRPNNIVPARSIRSASLPFLSADLYPAEESAVDGSPRQELRSEEVDRHELSESGLPLEDSVV